MQVTTLERLIKAGTTAPEVHAPTAEVLTEARELVAREVDHAELKKAAESDLKAAIARVESRREVKAEFKYAVEALEELVTAVDNEMTEMHRPDAELLKEARELVEGSQAAVDAYVRQMNDDTIAATIQGVTSTVEKLAAEKLAKDADSFHLMQLGRDISTLKGSWLRL